MLITPKTPDLKPSGPSLRLSWASNFGRTLIASAITHRALLIVSVLTWLLAKGANVHFDRTTGSGTSYYFEIIFEHIMPVLIPFILAVSVLKLLFIEKSKSPLMDMIHNYRVMLTDQTRWANIIVVIVAMIFGFSGFSELKPLISFVNAYSWDVRFMELDRLLHFGRDPWTLLSPIFGSPNVTKALNFFYNIWFYVLFLFWLGAAWTKPARHTLGETPDWSRQFTLSFMLCWVIAGIFLATLWSSMGPAFYDLVDPAQNPYAAQMTGLQEIDTTHHLWALQTQESLRQSYLFPGIGGPEGISAMPSLHNATAALFAFAGYRIHRYLGHAMVAFMIAILIGSVHLGWHYAIDGYAGILLAWAAWAAAGRILRGKTPA